MAEVVFSGYTPRYDDPKLLPHLREKLNRQIEKSALGAEKMVQQVGVDNLAAWLEQRKADGWTIIGLENNLEGDEAKRKIMLNEFENKDLEKVILILGEEVHGIPPEVRQECDWFLEIPMKGRKESFNVSVATGIAVWGIMNESS